MKFRGEMNLQVLRCCAGEIFPALSGREDLSALGKMFTLPPILEWNKRDKGYNISMYGILQNEFTVSSEGNGSQCYRYLHHGASLPLDVMIIEPLGTFRLSGLAHLSH